MSSPASSCDCTRTGRPPLLLLLLPFLPLPLALSLALLLQLPVLVLLLLLPLRRPVGHTLHLTHMPRKEAFGGGASGEGSQTEDSSVAAYSIT